MPTAVGDVAYGQGRVARPLRDVLVVPPPLVISTQEIEERVAKVRLAFNRVHETVTGSNGFPGVRQALHVPAAIRRHWANSAISLSQLRA